MKEREEQLSQFCIRPIKESDINALFRYVIDITSEDNPFIPILISEIPNQDDYSRQLHELLSSDVSTILTALDADKIIGRIDIQGNKRHAYKHIVSLAISVEKQYRQKGIGSMLLEAAIEWIKRKKYIIRIEIEVHVSNLTAIQLYKKFGFVEQGVFKKRIFHHNKYEDTFKLVLFID